jgi:hypothetical protein
MADARVGQCDPPAAHGIAARAGHAIVQALLLPRQGGAQGPELVSGRGIPWLYALQAPADPLHCTSEEPCPCGLTPGLVPLGLAHGNGGALSQDLIPAGGDSQPRSLRGDHWGHRGGGVCTQGPPRPLVHQLTGGLIGPSRRPSDRGLLPIRVLAARCQPHAASRGARPGWQCS